MGPGPVQRVVISAPVRTVPRDWLVRGYAEAHDRFRDASQHPDSPEGPFIPLFEALNWAGAHALAFANALQNGLTADSCKNRRNEKGPVSRAFLSGPNWSSFKP
jgi:hypothetical protein